MNKNFTFLILSFIFLSLFAQQTLANTKFEYTTDNKSENIKVYPNPLVDIATIKISADIDLSENKVSIVFYNLLGKEVYKIAQVKEYDIKISKDNFKFNGVYFYQLKIDERVQNTGKLIVK